MEIKYNSVQLEIVGPFRDKILQFSKDLNIYPDEIVELETNPHITILYGIEDKDLDAAKTFVTAALTRPLEVTFGITKMFIADDLNKDDVLFLDVYSPDILLLHTALKANINVKNDIFRNYYPHLTLAKLLPGRAMTYVGKSDFLNQEIKVENIVFSTSTKERIIICRSL